MKPHRGINMISIAGEGLNGMPGLLITIAYIFLFTGIFVPRNAGWFVPVFLAVEGGAAILYVRMQHRDREEVEELKKEMQRINDQSD